MRERHQEPDGLTSAMEDYLREIYQLARTGAPVTVGDLAHRMQVAAPSASSMVRRLAALGFVHHEPYRPINLTEQGRQHGRLLARRYRLLRYYLVKTLGYSWEDVDAEVNRMEHTVSEQMASRIRTQLDGHR